MSNFKFYTGPELFAMKFKPRPWLVENILHYKDSVLLVGGEKAGKSLLVFQLICSMTSQHCFLDKFEVKRPCRVTYLQLEGEIEDSFDRLNKMRKAIDLDENLLQFAFLPPVNFENPVETQEIIEQIKPHSPDLVIIDPVYFALEGDLSDNTAVRKFIGQMRILKNTLNCAVMMVHHTHKDRQSKGGRKINEGDEAAFGSKFFKAYPDHTILFSYDKKLEVRRMTCDTQRSGSIEKETTMVLEQPDPLYFRLQDKPATKAAVVLKAIDPQGSSYDEIKTKCELSKGVVYATLRELIGSELVTKTEGTRPVIYTKVSV